MEAIIHIFGKTKVCRVGDDSILSQTYKTYRHDNTECFLWIERPEDEYGMLSSSWKEAKERIAIYRKDWLEGREL